jgi:hypothetical protein
MRSIDLCAPLWGQVADLEARLAGEIVEHSNEVQELRQRAEVRVVYRPAPAFLPIYLRKRSTRRALSSRFLSRGDAGGPY